MPSYEAAIIFKALERPELAQAIKRTAKAVLENGGIIRSFENLGPRRLPYRMFRHGVRHSEGSFFLLQFDSPVAALPTLRDHYRRDLDIVRPRILRREVEVGRPCDREPCAFGELSEELRKKLNLNIKEFVQKM